MPQLAAERSPTSRIARGRSRKPRPDRRELWRDIKRQHRREAKEKLASLRAEIRSARERRKVALVNAKARCRAGALSHSVVRLTSDAGLLSVRGEHGLEGHLVITKESVQALKLSFTPHRLGKTQAGVARKLAPDSFQSLGASRVAAPRYSSAMSSSFIEKL
jgi:hypothetical protein